MTLEGFENISSLEGITLGIDWNYFKVSIINKMGSGIKPGQARPTRRLFWIFYFGGERGLVVRALDF